MSVPQHFQFFRNRHRLKHRFFSPSFFTFFNLDNRFKSVDFLRFREFIHRLGIICYFSCFCDMICSSIDRTRRNGRAHFYTSFGCIFVLYARFSSLPCSRNARDCAQRCCVQEGCPLLRRSAPIPRVLCISHDLQADPVCRKVFESFRSRFSHSFFQKGIHTL